MFDFIIFASGATVLAFLAAKAKEEGFARSAAASTLWAMIYGIVAALLLVEQLLSH